MLFIAVYGWLSDTYIGEERFQEHVLMTGFRKGFEDISQQIEVTFDVISISSQGLKGTLIDAKYIVTLLIFYFRSQGFC